MTGGSAAVPIWTQYMKNYAERFPAIDFKWAEGTELKELSVEEQKAMGVPDEEKRPLENIQLLFNSTN